MAEDMTGMISWSIMDTIGRYIMDHSTPRYWDAPLIGFADAESTSGASQYLGVPCSIV